MKKQTFILEVNDSQNESWQGSVEWIQGEKKQPFRSVMELLRLPYAGKKDTLQPVGILQKGWMLTYENSTEDESVRAGTSYE